MSSQIPIDRVLPQLPQGLPENVQILPCSVHLQLSRAHPKDAIYVLVDELNRIRKENLSVFWQPGLQRAINLLRESRHKET